MTNLKQKSEEVFSFTVIPRKIPADFKAGKLNRNELILLMWLRANGDTFGKVTVNFKALKEDMLPDLSLNAINKLMLKLRKHMYLYYEDRQGKSGSFEVSLDEWPIKGGRILRVDKYFESSDEKVVQKTGPIQSEASQKSVVENQKFSAMKSQWAQGFSMAKPKPQIGSNYTDTYKETDTDNIDSKESSFKPNNPINSFIPSDSEEDQCWQIAKDVGEPDMTYILAKYRANGLGLLQRARGILVEQIQSGSIGIQNKAAYFNKIVEQLIAEKEAQRAKYDV